jgi:uncharacterized membrane protein YfcA
MYYQYTMPPGEKCGLVTSIEEVELSTVMQLVIINSTITSFFSHFMIEKSVVANTVSVVVASLITWVLIGDLAVEFDATYMRNIFITVLIALVISMIVGRVFAYHKKCS